MTDTAAILNHPSSFTICGIYITSDLQAREPYIHCIRALSFTHDKAGAEGRKPYIHFIMLGPYLSTRDETST